MVSCVQGEGGGAVAERNTATEEGAQLIDVEITDDDLRTELYKKIIRDHRVPPVHTHAGPMPPAPLGSAGNTPERRRGALVVAGSSGYEDSSGVHPTQSLSVANGIAAISKALAECEVALDRCAFLSAVRWGD